jgi:hypothetical protein
MSDVLRMTVERMVYGRRIYAERSTDIALMESLKIDVSEVLLWEFNELKHMLDKHEREIKTKKLPLP